jgi:hypothetical protein
MKVALRSIPDANGKFPMDEVRPGLYVMRGDEVEILRFQQPTPERQSMNERDAEEHGYNEGLLFRDRHPPEDASLQAAYNRGYDRGADKGYENLGNTPSSELSRFFGFSRA